MPRNDNIQKTTIPGLLIVKRPTFSDKRGYFREVFQIDELNRATKTKFRPLQWNHSSSKPKVIRALHAENWNKLVYPVTGKMFAAIVDIKQDSETFGKVETFEFNTSDPDQLKALYIPKGLANSICVVGDESVNYMYLVDAYYDGSDTRAIAWNDPDLNIQWPVADPIISERDQNNPTMRELFPHKYE